MNCGCYAETSRPSARPRLSQRDQRLQQFGDAIRRRGGEGRGDLGGARRAGQVRQRAAWACSTMRVGQGREGCIPGETS